MAIDWVIVKDSWNHKPIGAVGFIGDKVAVITAFYDDKDWNTDGKVGPAERFLLFGKLQGKALAEVATHASADFDLRLRDPTITHLRGQLTVQFAAGLLVEGIYKAWFSVGIGRVAGALAGAITSNAVKAFVVKKGMEKAVEAAYRASMGR